MSTKLEKALKSMAEIKDAKQRLNVIGSCTKSTMVKDIINNSMIACDLETDKLFIECNKYR